MPPVRHVIYLHGFTSSPASSKAQRFERELRARDVGFYCPDLNVPKFESLTITRMLGQVGDVLATIDRGPVALVGSSLGAFVALHAAAADRRGLVDRLLLLAPAFDFGGNRLRVPTAPANEQPRVSSRERSGDRGVPASERVGGSAGAKPPGL